MKFVERYVSARLRSRTAVRAVYIQRARVCVRFSHKKKYESEADNVQCRQRRTTVLSAYSDAERTWA